MALCKNTRTEMAAEEPNSQMASDAVTCSRQENDAVEQLPEMAEAEPTDKSAQHEAQTAPQADALAEFPPLSKGVREIEILSELRTLFETQIARNKNQATMFDALYREMKDYKENFLLEAIHKPIIKDLIMLYDNFARLVSQLDELMNANEQISTDEIAPFRTNLENVRFQLLEVLFRLDVTPYEQRLEQLDRKLHKTLKVIPTDNPEQDGKVTQVHKIGFYWREKVFRPEEVTILRYMPPATGS